MPGIIRYSRFPWQTQLRFIVFKLKPMDVTLTVAKKAVRIDREVTRSGCVGNARPSQNAVSEIVKKMTIDEFNNTGELKNYVVKDVADQLEENER